MPHWMNYRLSMYKPQKFQDGSFFIFSHVMLMAAATRRADGSGDNPGMIV